MSDLLIARYGTAAPVEAERVLTAGSLSAVLTSGGALGAVRHDGVELLRGVAYIVRDRNWATVDPVLSGLVVEETGSGFTVRYCAVCSDGAQVVRLQATIEATRDRLAFVVEAMPDGDFETARCGFAVLHPAEVAGSAVRVTHADGTVEEASFPDLIDPWQPFKAIRSIAHRPADGLSVTCRLEGDVFEMEDQRNWTDASFKTYVRPLELPWPYVMPGGVPDRQSVTLSILDRRPRAAVAAAPDGPVRVVVDDPCQEAGAMPATGPATGMPGIGLLLDPEDALDAASPGLIDAVSPQALTLHFDPGGGHGQAALDAFARATRDFAGEIVLELPLQARETPDRECARVASAIGRSGLRLTGVMVSPAVDRRATLPGSAWPPCPPLAEVYRAARRHFASLRLGGGMLAYFTELNRKRPPLDQLDFVSHSTCPLVHAADDLSVMQTLETLPAIFRSTRSFVGDLAYRIGPSTIGMRHNPYGDATRDNPDRVRIAMAADDPRQRGLFAAAWMVGYLAATREARIESVTVAGLLGPRGVWTRDQGGLVRHPVFHTARGLSEIGGARRLPCVSSAPSRVAALCAVDAKGRRVLWLANLTAATIAVTLAGPSGEIAMLDEQNPQAMRPVPGGESLAMSPFAVARIVA